jgi:transcriptional regulator GlxA family with amidase domain
MTPMQYLKRLRLEGARSELLQAAPGSRVVDVAYRWGFAHHGVFSASYADVFGELPSVTLRRGHKS